MSALDILDQYVSPEIRSLIEQRYYAKINAQARLDYFINDPEFLRNPDEHVALYPDHGVAHVRDVARQILRVLDNVHGVLIPARSASRFQFMQALAVMVSYAHDIGMMDYSRFGRAMHAEFATQTVLGAEFDDIMAMLWAQDCGGIATYLSKMSERGLLSQGPSTVLREMIAMANCHSKSKVPVETLNNPLELRKVMQAAATTNLQRLYYQQRIERARRALVSAQQVTSDYVELDRLTDALREAERALELNTAHLPREMTDNHKALSTAYHWLAQFDGHKENRDLADDVVDTLRALRCADALRQRGTVLKTSGNYEVFIDQLTATGICALRTITGDLLLMKMPRSINDGEINIASSEMGKDGNLRISFHRGSFPDQSIVEHAARNAAQAVNDIQLDVIESFQRPRALPANDALKSWEDVQIHLEGVDDNMEFVHLVINHLRAMNPRAAERARAVPSTQNTSEREIRQYLGGDALDWDLAHRQQLLARLAMTGYYTAKINARHAFEHVRLAQLSANETLIEADDPANYVFIPLVDGLRCYPLGGYPPFNISAYTALGNTGVIRGAQRNAKVIAEKDRQLLMIPKEVFLRHWHHTLSPAELILWMTTKQAQMPALNQVMQAQL